MKISEAIAAADWLVDASDMTAIEVVNILIEFFPGVKSSDVVHCKKPICITTLLTELDPLAKANDVTIRFWGGGLASRKWLNGTVLDYLRDKLYWNITMLDFNRNAYRAMEHMTKKLAVGV